MVVIPMINVDGREVRSYWDAMIEADTLKYRFSDEVNPTLKTVQSVIERMYLHMFAVLDGEKMVAEFMLENFIGKSAQLHFSFRPDTMEKATICRLVLDTVFVKLESVYGLTPKPNRAACIFALRNGFKKIGILPSGCTYMGKTEDVQIAVAVRDGN